MVAEFDDSALMKAFGKQGAGIFVVPSAIENEVSKQYQVEKIGQVEEIKEAFYVISVERRISNPVVSMIMESARETLFADINLTE
jgi:LysR family transcriptional activator of nhaA